MKFIRPGQAGAPYVFRVSAREKALLLATLKMFPMLDAGFHHLTRDRQKPNAAEQQWLEQAMAEQRAGHKKKLDQLFADERRFFKAFQSEFQFTLNAEQMEWLLRVLNEIRVGSWVQLGRPELDEARKAGPNEKHPSALAAMELSGYFQQTLLEAFR